MTIDKSEQKLLATALAYFLDHNEEFDFNDEEANNLMDKLTESPPAGPSTE